MSVRSLPLIIGFVAILLAPATWSGGELVENNATSSSVASEASAGPETVSTPPDGAIAQSERTVPWYLIVALVLYIALVLFVRHIWVIVPSRNHLLRKIDAVEASLGVEQEAPAVASGKENAVIPKLQKLLQTARSEMGGPWYKHLGTARQQASWRRVHQAESLAVHIYSSDVVKAKAELAARRLAALEDFSLDPRASLSTAGVARDLEGAQRSSDVGERRAALTEALRVINEARDGYFEILSEWFNKSIWLIGLAALLIVALSVSLSPSNASLFLLGAVGGLLSKLRGAVKRRNVPFDYGVSWTTLFLTPLVGGLTGWAGILLTDALLQAKVLGGAFFEAVQWGATHGTTTMALAILFGFSAGLFEKLVDAAEAQVEVAPKKA